MINTIQNCFFFGSLYFLDHGVVVDCYDGMANWSSWRLGHYHGWLIVVARLIMWWGLIGTVRLSHYHGWLIVAVGG